MIKIVKEIDIENFVKKFKQNYNRLIKQEKKNSNAKRKSDRTGN